jgi:hypothetical protein
MAAIASLNAISCRAATSAGIVAEANISAPTIVRLTAQLAIGVISALARREL